MNRAFLCSAIERLSSKCGYSFQLNDKSYYPTTVCQYPSAFMLQPEFLSMEGRKHGKIAYKVTLRLAHQGAKLSPTERNALLNRMEEQMMQLFVELSQAECVALVENLTIAPCAEPIDSHGAVAIEAKADVITIF